MPLYTVWPSGSRPEQFPEIEAYDAGQAARQAAAGWYAADGSFHETVFVQERNSDTATLYQVRAVPEIEFYAEEI